MKKIFSIIFLLLFIIPLPAQEKENEYKYWMTYGVFLSDDILSGNAGYSFSLGDNFFKVGYTQKSGFTLFGSGLSVDNSGYYFQVFDISIGKRFRSEWFQAAFFAGPSYVFGEKEINQEYIGYKTPGLQSDIQLLFLPANEVGLGIGFYGNLNFEKSFAGININITLGNGK